MGKAPDAFRTISEVADWLGVQTHVLRFWESKFSQVKPLKRAGGRRYYRPSDMELLGGIRKLLHEDGLTIKGAQKFIRERGVKAVAALSPPVDAATQAPAEAPASGVEAAAGPETGAERRVPGGRAPRAAPVTVEMTGEAPAPAAEVHIPRARPDAAADRAGEEPAPAAQGAPDLFDTAVSMEGEDPAPAARVHIERDGPEEAVDMSAEALPAPERKSNIVRDAPEEAPEDTIAAAAEEEDLELPVFIRKPVEGRETTIPPVTPGPLPLGTTVPEPDGDSRFFGVGAARMPERDDAAAPPEEAAGDLAAAAGDSAAAGHPAPETPRLQSPAATPEAALDIHALRGLYARLIALRARMG